MFDALKSVPLFKEYDKPNHYLVKAVESIKSAYPHKFLQEHELKYRKFYDQPASVIPYESHVVDIPRGKK